MKVTLKFLVENNVIDENQKVIIYSMNYDKNVGKWEKIYKGFIYSLVAENHPILDEDCSIAEIKKDDLDFLIKNDFKKDYIGIYLN